MELEDYWSAFGCCEESIYCCRLREKIDTDVKPLRHAVHLKQINLKVHLVPQTQRTANFRYKLPLLNYFWYTIMAYSGNHAKPANTIMLQQCGLCYS
jgi:hypothetical protein